MAFAILRSTLLLVTSSPSLRVRKGGAGSGRELANSGGDTITKDRK